MAQVQVPVGRVTAVHGQAFVRTADGQQHELKVNDVVHEGDVIITSAGGDVELTFAAGKTYTIHGNEVATLDATVFSTDVPTPADAALNTDGSQLNNITQAIANGNSLDSLLEATAAGLTGGGGGDSTHSFVQLLRIAEAVGPAGTSYQFDATGSSNTTTQGGQSNVGVEDPTIAINAITGDNLVNGAEAAKTIIVTGLTGGGAQAGDTVVLTVNGKTFTGTVAADHTFSIGVPGSDIAADSHVTATVTAGPGAAAKSATASVAYDVDLVAEASITINSVTADNIVNAAESKGSIAISGTVGGDVKVGDTVTLTVNGHDYTGTVAAGNTYSISVKGSDLAADSNVRASVTATDNAGNTATATTSHGYAVDLVAEASIAINAITADNIVNAAESKGNLTVSGTVGGDAKVGDTVTLSINGHDYSATVQAGNTWSVAVKGSDLAGASNVNATVTVTDTAGNTATATASHGYTVDTVAEASITIDSIAGDNVINAAEAAGNIAISGKVGGDVKVGDTVTLTVNGHTYTGTVQNGNTWSISVKGSDLAAGSNVEASVTATDNAGNTATATADHGYSVHTEASAALTINSVTSDNIVDANEVKGNIVITGHAGGDAKAGDVVTLTVNGHDYSGTVQSGGGYAISVAGSDLAAANNIHGSVTVTDSFGNTTTATANHAYGLQLETAPATASITINAITSDNIINAAEAQGNVSVTGSVGGDAKTGDTVTLTVNGNNYTGTVAANGTYSISVAGSDLAQATSVHASVTATNSDGNTATATADHSYSVVMSGEASITVDSITSDNIVNASEAKDTVNVTGSVSGDAKAGDTVTLTVNGHDYTGTVAANGTYSIAVAGGDLAADSKVHASVAATDSAGNPVTASANHGYTVDMAATASISINDITSDNVINASEAAGNVSVTGTVGGDVKAGDTVTLTVNGQTYTGTVQDDNTFSISVKGDDLKADSSVHASVTATDNAGNTATATAAHDYSVALSGSASITVDAITADNVVNATEAAGNINVTGTVSGDAKAGDTVTLTVNGHDYTGTVAANGTYSISVAGSDLKDASSVHASVAATDTAGNAVTASTTHSYTVDTSASATISLNSITDDNVINASEAAGNVSVTGTVGGDVKTGDTVTLTVNGQTYTGTVQDGNTFSISVKGDDLKAASSVHASVTATDNAGNTATATDDHAYTVDTVATATITITSVAGDNIVNAAEAASNASVTGTVGGDAKAGDTVTLTVNGHDYTGTVQQGNTFSISVKGDDLKADSSVHASVTATDSAGNTATATADHGYTLDMSAAASISIDAITGDNVINATEANGNVTVTGTVAGDVKVGDTVTLTVHGQDYTGTVQDGNTFSISVKGSDLAADNNVHASVTATDSAGNTATATADQGYTVDTGATASITINDITSDNIVNAAEAQGNVSVTGTVGGDAKTGDTVTLTINGNNYTGTVAANGTYSISVVGSDLAKDSNVHASITVHDSAGNTATATNDHVYTVDTSASATISLNSITDDNVINASEAAGNVSVTGTVGGDVKAGDTVTLTVNGQTYTGTVDAGHAFSISVKGDDLKADSKVHASVTATDNAGNTATATADQSYTVDTTATATITINAITADNIVNATEAAGTVNVTGTAGGDAKTGDTVTLTVHGNTYTGTVAADGTYSVAVNGGDLAADNNVHASITVHDVAGNAATATADHTYTVDTTATATITVDSITSDNVLTAAEAAGNINVTGTVGGDAKAGDTVTLTVHGNTYTGTVAANGTYSVSVKGSDLAATNNVHASVTATDSAGNTVTATADHAYDNAPTVATATATVSEEGLTGANADTTGSPTDTTNSTTATGHVTISDVDSSSFLVTLTAPTTTITSGGTALTWTGDGTGQLVGKAGSTTVVTIAIDNTGAYTVTLSGPIDHPDKTVEDVLGFNVGVVVNDKGGGTTSSTLTVNVEDDSPVWTSSSANTSIEGTAGATVTGDLHLSIGADSGTGAKVLLSGSGLDSNGYIQSTAGQYVTYNGLKLHYVSSGDDLIATASDGTQVYKVSGDVHAGTYEVTMLKSLDSTTATSATFTSVTAGNNNTYTFSDSGHLYGITVTGTQNGSSATVNTNSSQFGVANNWIDSGESIKFAFDQHMTGIQVTLDGSQFKSSDHATYTVHYLDGTTGSGTIDGNSSGSVTASLSFTKAFDSITFNGTTDAYRLTLGSITGTTTKQDQSIQFTATGVDADGDSTSSHVITTTFNYDGTLTSGSSASASGGSSSAEVLSHELAIDTFAWQLADKNVQSGLPTGDKSSDLGTSVQAAGDRLDLRDLLMGEHHSNGGNLANYLHFEKSGSDTIVHVSSNGGFANGYSASAEHQTVVLSNVDLAALYHTTSDAMIIQHLLQNNKLVLD